MGGPQSNKKEISVISLSIFVRFPYEKVKRVELLKSIILYITLLLLNSPYSFHIHTPIS